MLTIKQIQEDLKDIRYYYSKQKIFESASKSLVQNSLVDKIDKYTNAIKDAPIRLYDLYISLYIHNNTQATVAYDWGHSEVHICNLHKKLCEYFQNVLT